MRSKDLKVGDPDKSQKEDNMKSEDLQVGTIIVHTGSRCYGYVINEHVVIDLLKDNDVRFVSRCEAWSHDYAKSIMLHNQSVKCTHLLKCTHLWKKSNVCTYFKLYDPYGRISIEI